MVTNDECNTIAYGLFLSEFCHCSATLSIFYQTTALSILSMAYMAGHHKVKESLYM